MVVNMSANFRRIRCTGRVSILSRTVIGMPAHSRMANSMAKVRTLSPMDRLWPEIGKTESLGRRSMPMCPRRKSGSTSTEFGTPISRFARCAVFAGRVIGPLQPIVRSSAVFRPFCLPCFGYGVDYGQLIESHPAGDRIECFDPFPVALPADKHQTGAFGKNSEHRGIVGGPRAGIGLARDPC